MINLILALFITSGFAQESDKYIFGECVTTYVDDTMYCATRKQICFVQHNFKTIDGDVITRFSCKEIAVFDKEENQQPIMGE